MSTNEIIIGEHITPTSFKGEGSGAYFAEFNGSPAVVKQGDTDTLQKEHDILSRVAGPGIPAVLEFQTEESGAQLVIERLSGDGLDTLIGLDEEWNSTPLTLDIAKQIVGGLSERLKQVRDGGFLYRDLNFGHILIDESDPSQVGLVDLECAIPLQEQGAVVDTKQGTWEIMAPEEFTPGNAITEAANTYALGVILMQLVGGKNPFFVSGKLIPDADQQRQTSLFLHSKGPSYLPMQDEPVGALLEKALNYDPSQRFTTIEEFQDALNTLS